VRATLMGGKKTSLVYGEATACNHSLGVIRNRISQQRNYGLGGLSSLMLEFLMSQESIISCLKRH
jgi:hypothetical protein